MVSCENSFLHVSKRNVKFNARIKIYPDGSKEILCADSAIFSADGWEEAGREREPGEPQRLVRERQSFSDPANVARAQRRAAARVRDIALCNRFSHFVTLTLSAETVDRYDIKDAMRKMRVWLDNRVRRNGLKYVLVPEHHKDGAIHFHGFVNDVLPLADSGTISAPGQKKPRRPQSARQRDDWLAAGGKVVYNISDWALGFSTAIELYGEYEAAISYCCKYIGKEARDDGAAAKIGGRWYYSGGRLDAPRLDFATLDFRSLEAAGAYRFDIEAAGLSFCLLRTKGE